jgi:hypothetical protein
MAIFRDRPQVRAWSEVQESDSHAALVSRFASVWLPGIALRPNCEQEVSIPVRDCRARRQNRLSIFNRAIA